MIYHAVPVRRCRCPAKVFPNAPDALDYAQKAADAFRVGYAVWRIQGQHIQLVKRFPPVQIQARA